MKNMTSSTILELLRQHGRMRPHDLLQHLGVKRAALHRQLLKLQSSQQIEKVGTPPRVFYQLTNKKKMETRMGILDANAHQKKLLEDFVIITPNGEYLEHEDAFIHWCNKQNLPLQKTLKEYEQTRKKYDSCKKIGFIDGTKKLKATFADKIYMDTLYYLDFYSIERFGKTKLGTLMLYAKQSQNRELIKKIVSDVQPRILLLMKKQKIDAVCFVPPTIKREIQFMYELERMLAIDLPTIKMEKLKMPIIIPQKTIGKLSDRIENAQATLHVQSASHTYNNVLLIDDAVGSGATMNVSAHILKKGHFCSKVIGLGLTGSYKGFDVISEV